MSAVLWPKPRALSRLAPDRPAVIEASAGTGKTYTLEHLVVDLLLRGDLPIESILVVTYTERAASELRARIRAKLGQLLAARAADTVGSSAPGEAPSASLGLEDAWTLDDAAREKLVRALNNFDLAAISTIHAFCQSTLVENAFLGRRLFDQELVDGRIAFARAFIVALRRVLARDAEHRPYLEAWLVGHRLEEAEKLLYECATKRGVFRPVLDPEALTARVLELRASWVEPARLRAALEGARVRKQTADAVLDRHAALGKMLAPFHSARDLPRFIADVDEEEEERGLLGFLAARLVECGGHDRKLGATHKAIQLLARELPNLESAVAQRLLPPVREELARAKSRRGELDFDDMLSLLDASLSGPRGDELARAIAARYAVALVDEFQDTDDIQWRIFERVFLEHTPPRPLFVIGDPKQAIYAFRGADVHTYLRATQQIRDLGGARVTLTESFRSTPDMIEALNVILDDRAPEPFFPGEIRYDAPVEAARAPSPADLEGAPVHVLSLVPGENPLGRPALRETLARFIAREASRLIESESVRPNDIFVLTRTTRESNEVGAHLRRAGVPHAFYKQEGLFQTREALEISTLLTAVVDPSHTSRRVRAWTGPFFEVPLEALPGCLDLPGTHPLYARLAGWHAIAARKDYGRLFNAILDESGILRRLLFFGESERELTNYLHIFELLLEEGNRTRATLEELVHALSGFIEGRRAPEGESGNVQRLESERAAVQIMTEHKAKGLEARVVFVYGGFDAARTGAVEVVHDGGERVLELGAEALKDKKKQEREEEDRRLLYVAITRAKERLYLPHLPSTERLNGAYRALNVALERVLSAARSGTKPRLAELFFETSLPVEADPGDGRRPAEPGSLLGFAPPPELLLDLEPASDLARLARTRFGWLVTSYSRLKSASGGYHPPEKVEAEPPADAEADPDRAASLDAAEETEITRLPGGSVTGRFLHEVLEKMPVETFDAGALPFWRSRADVKRIFEEAAKRYAIDTRYLPHAEELVYVALAGPIAAKGLALPRGIGATKRILREMEFLYPIPEADHPPLGERHLGGRLSIARGFIKGFIDLIFEHEGRLYVVDWKSDFLPSYAADAVEVHCAHNYGLQADLYTLAVVKMLGLRSHAEFERRFGGTLYCFVRGMKLEHGPSVGVRYTRARWSDVVAFEARLRQGLDRADEGGES